MEFLNKFLIIFGAAGLCFQSFGFGIFLIRKNVPRLLINANIVVYIFNIFMLVYNVVRL